MVLQPQGERFLGNSWGSARALGPGRKSRKRKHSPGNSSAVSPPDGGHGARAPPRGQRWHPTCNHLCPPPLQSKTVKMPTAEMVGTSPPGAGVLFCQGQRSQCKERCPARTRRLEVGGSRTFTSAFRMENFRLRPHVNARISNANTHPFKSTAWNKVQTINSREVDFVMLLLTKGSPLCDINTATCPTQNGTGGEGIAVTQKSLS